MARLLWPARSQGCSTPESDNGELLWQLRVGKAGRSGHQWGFAADRSTLTFLCLTAM